MVRIVYLNANGLHWKVAKVCQEKLFFQPIFLNPLLVWLNLWLFFSAPFSYSGLDSEKKRKNFGWSCKMDAISNFKRNKRCLGTNYWILCNKTPRKTTKKFLHWPKLMLVFIITNSNVEQSQDFRYNDTLYYNPSYSL